MSTKPVRFNPDYENKSMRIHDDGLWVLHSEGPTEAEFVKIIEEWKHAWMNVTGTDEADASNYFERAFGIDANMKYDLARRLVKMKPIEKGKTDGE